MPDLKEVKWDEIIDPNDLILLNDAAADKEIQE